MKINVEYQHAVGLMKRCAELGLECRVCIGISHPPGYITHEVLDWKGDPAPWLELGKYLRMLNDSESLCVVSSSGKEYEISFGYTDFEGVYLTMFVFDEKGELIEYNGNGVKAQMVKLIDEFENNYITNKAANENLRSK